jgi:two-component system sensor histidine kinase UhpB
MPERQAPPEPPETAASEPAAPLGREREQRADPPQIAPTHADPAAPPERAARTGAAAPPAAAAASAVANRPSAAPPSAAAGGPQAPASPSPATGEADVLARLRRIASENERLFEELLGAERRYRGLARAVWNVQEEERRRLARELHDGIGQTLTALKNHLDHLAGKAAAAGSRFTEDLAAAAETAGGAVHETRELSRLLRPPVLDDLGLVPALRWLVRTLEKRTGLAIELTVGGELAADGGAAEGGGAAEAPARLEPDLETLVFRVVQEALTNTLKHSGARRAAVSLSADAAAVRVHIADAGAGFDPDATLDAAPSSTGVGLAGMRDRVELFGGRLALTSAPGRGTEVQLSVPRTPPDGPAWAVSGEGR